MCSIGCLLSLAPMSQPLSVNNIEVIYTNDLSDIEALTIFSLEANDRYRRNRLISVYINPLIFFLIFAFISYQAKSMVFIYVGLFIVLSIGLYRYRAYKKYPLKLVTDFNNRHKQKNVFCEHKILITQEGVTETTEETCNKHSWKSLYKIEVLNERIFIFTSPITAHIIPKREVGDEIYGKLVNEIGKYT